MRMHQVEVDEEVFQFIKGQAEPLVDTFNSTLRRLLAISKPRVLGIASAENEGVHTNPVSLLPLLPKRLPKALQQILEVVHLVRNNQGRSDATRYVAKQHKIAQQTVIDKYTRQLKITASEFDKLLDQTNLSELRKILNFKFPEHSQLIDEVYMLQAKH
jgi:negative regulator of replication initiation